MKYLYFSCLYCLTLLLFSPQTSAQNYYIQGYIVQNSGDTVRGLIDYRNWGVNPDKVHFKLNNNSESKVFKPSQIKAFSVTDELYISAKVQTETSPDKTSLETHAELNLVEDSVFLQTLIFGNKSLFYYKSPTGKNNFYILNNGTYELLYHKKYLKKTAKASVVTENKKYIGQLIVYLDNCNSFKTKTSRIKYSQRSLLSAFESYYKCTKEKILFKKEEEKLTTEIGVLAGGTYTTLKIGGENTNEIPDLSSSKNMTLGFSFDIVFPRNHRMWSIVNEINSPNYFFEEDYINNERDTVHLELGYRYLKINNMLRFTYPLNHVNVFINAGMGNGFALIETNYMKITPDGPFHKYPREKEFLESRKYEQSILGGAGVRWKNISIEYRIEYGNGISKYPLLSTKTTRNYILMGIKF